MENFFSYRHRVRQGIAIDARKLPEGETLEKHLLRCTAHKRRCPYVADLRDAQNDLLRAYLGGGVTGDLADKARQLLEAVVAGKGWPLRMPAQVFRSKMAKLVPMWMQLAYVVAGASNDIRLQDRVLEDFAKAAGAYLGDIDRFFAEHYGGMARHGGMEAEVFHTGDGFVVKNSSLDMGTYGTLMKIERIMLGNIAFPETAYVPFAVGHRKLLPLRFALRQPEVQENRPQLTQAEITDWMAGRGWTWIGDCAYASHDKRLKSLDMHEGNVVRTRAGDVVCVDSCVVPYLYNYDAPPSTLGFATSPAR